MTIKLIATDMDGTFLDDRGSYDRQRFEIVLARLEERKIPFVVATGNSMGRLLDLFAGLENRILFVADNGGHVYENGQTRVRKILSIEQIEEVLAFYQGHLQDYCMMLAHDETIYMEKGAGYPFDDSLAIEPDQMQAFVDRIVFLPDLHDFPRHQTFYKMGLWVAEDQVERLCQEFNAVFAGKLTAVTSGYGTVDLLPADIHKAWGLEKILSEREISPQDVLAFGDSDNDIELLSYVGHSYAMGNATARVKAAARFLAPSHKEDGVLAVIEEYLEKEKP